MKHVLTTTFTAALLWGGTSFSLKAAPPIIDYAYVNGEIVTITVQDPHKGKVPLRAQNTYFEVIYPFGWESLTDSIPLCNPCDHGLDGDDLFDYHDHVFAGQPAQPGKGEYGPLWRLNFVVPAYNGDADHDDAVSEAYAAFLPTTSAEAVYALLAATLPDGSPIAERIDVDYVFLAAIVDPHAGKED